MLFRFSSKLIQDVAVGFWPSAGFFGSSYTFYLTHWVTIINNAINHVSCIVLFSLQSVTTTLSIHTYLFFFSFY